MINLGPSNGSPTTERNDLLNGLGKVPDSKGSRRARPLMACCSRRPKPPQHLRPIGSMIPTARADGMSATGFGGPMVPTPPRSRGQQAQSSPARSMRSLQAAPSRSAGYSQSFMATAPLWTRCGNDLSISTEGDLVTFARKRRGSVVNAASNGMHCGVAICDNVLLRAGKNVASFKVVKSKHSNIMLGVGRPTLSLEGEPVMDFWGIYLRDSDLGNGTLWHRGQQYPWHGMQGAIKGDELTMIMNSDLGSLEVFKNGARLGVACEGLDGDLCWAVALWDPGDRVRITDPTIDTTPVVIASTPERAAAVSAYRSAGAASPSRSVESTEVIHITSFED